MKMTTHRNIIAACTTLAMLTVWGAAPADAKKRPTNQPATQAANDATEQTAQPPLWRISNDRGEIYILATLHFLPDDIAWRSRDIARAIDASEAIWLEVDAQSPAAQDAARRIIAEEGANPEGVLLSDLLTKEDANRLATFSNTTNAPIDVLNAMAPWQAFFAIGVQEIIDSGLKPGEGIGVTLSKEAIARGRRIRFLDTIDDQLLAFAALSTATQIELTRLRLARWGAHTEHLDALAAEWTAGDLTQLDILLNAPLRDQAPAAYQQLVIDRNAAWADRLVSILTSAPGRHFMLLNAANLAGPDNLIRLLANKGISVERIGAPASPAATASETMSEAMSETMPETAPESLAADRPPVDAPIDEASANADITQTDVGSSIATADNVITSDSIDEETGDDVRALLESMRQADDEERQDDKR